MVLYNFILSIFGNNAVELTLMQVKNKGILRQNYVKKMCTENEKYYVKLQLTLISLITSVFIKSKLRLGRLVTVFWGSVEVTVVSS